MLRYKLFVLLVVVGAYGASAQELFVQTEPASNMPAKSVGVRLSNWMMDEQATARVNYHLIPELMWGVNKYLMIHAEGFVSNRVNTNALVVEGGGLYAKYRFYSRDAVKRHFRMAVFGRVSVNNADIHQEEIQTNGHNSGYQIGGIATSLLHKTAISGSVYYHHALDNLNSNEIPATAERSAINYSLSGGRLMLPKSYTGYGQVNMNIMMEVLGQVLAPGGKQYMDLAPSVQFIFNSQTRVDIGYKYELFGNMLRTAPNGFILRVEHLLFNVL